MKLWISGEVDSDIGDAFRHTLNIIELSVNNVIEPNDYGSGLNSWDIIFIISKEQGQEICRYSKKNKETDIRLNIDHDVFKKSNKVNRQKMFLNGLLKSINLLRAKKIDDLNLDKLQLDIETLTPIEI